MKIAVLGTGDVGQTIGTKLVAVGHEVKMGARDTNNAKAKGWVESAGEKASHGSFAAAAAFGDLVFNCTLGVASLDVVKAAGAQNLEGKILVDVSNPLDFSAGMPPSLFAGNTDSLGERIQAALPGTKVVKVLNTVAAEIMVNPGLLPGEHDLLMCGDDPVSKSKVVELLEQDFGWKSIIDLGGIAMARGTESYLALWIRLWGATGTHRFNIRVVH